jgi:hypothetical protein
VGCSTEYPETVSLSGGRIERTLPAPRHVSEGLRIDAKPPPRHPDLITLSVQSAKRVSYTPSVEIVHAATLVSVFLVPRCC